MTTLNTSVETSVTSVINASKKGAAQLTTLDTEQPGRFSFEQPVRFRRDHSCSW